MLIFPINSYSQRSQKGTRMPPKKHTRKQEVFLVFSFFALIGGLASLSTGVIAHFRPDILLQYGSARTVDVMGRVWVAAAGNGSLSALMGLAGIISFKKPKASIAAVVLGVLSIFMAFWLQGQIDNLGSNPLNLNLIVTVVFSVLFVISAISVMRENERLGKMESSSLPINEDPEKPEGEDASSNIEKKIE